MGCDIKNIKIFDIRKTKNITFSHEPINLENNKNLNICGHYHPKIYLKNNGDKLSFSCFAMDKNKNTLSNEPLEKRVEKLIKNFSD